MISLDNGKSEVEARQFMESFVIAGKAKTVFQLLKLKAREEKKKNTERKK